jgi:hypothetical protein
VVLHPKKNALAHPQKGNQPYDPKSEATQRLKSVKGREKRKT